MHVFKVFSWALTRRPKIVIEKWKSPQSHRLLQKMRCPIACALFCNFQNLNNSPFKMYMHYLIIDKKCVQLKIQQKQASCADQEKVSGLGGGIRGIFMLVMGVRGIYLKKWCRFKKFEFSRRVPPIPIDPRMSIMSLYFQWLKQIDCILHHFNESSPKQANRYS